MLICIGWEWVPSNISQWFRRWTILGKLAFLHIPEMLAGNLANFLRNCNICKQNKVYILCCRYIPVFGIPFIDRIDLPFLGYLHKKRRINYRCKNRDIIIIIICMIILFWKKICYSFCNLDVRMSQNELPKGRIKSETIDSIPRAQHKLP